MHRPRWRFPFNAEQTVSVVGEIGPLVAMFLVNGIYDIYAGCVALIVATLASLIVTLWVLGRPPIMPFIAGGVSITFGALTMITHDPMWVQIKVTIFNAMFAAFLFGGLYFKRNFFKYVFEKTFHYTEEGWNKFTWNFAWFFVFTAFANEAVRLTFKDERVYDFLGLQMDGVGIWIAFKVALIMPLSGLYAYYLTRLMQRYRIPEPSERIALAAPVATAPRAAPRPPSTGTADRPGLAKKPSEHEANLG